MKTKVIRVKINSNSNSDQKQKSIIISYSWLLFFNSNYSTWFCRI